MKIRFVAFGALLALGCSAGNDIAEGEVGTRQEAISVIPEFPNTVLPMRFVSASGCLAVSGASLAQDANVTSETCDVNKKSQDWFLVPLKDGSFQVKPGHVAEMLLSIRGASTAVGGTAQTWGNGAVAAANARWEVVPTAGGTHQLKNMNSALCLSSNGAQASCATATKFTLSAKWDFPFSITAKHSGKCLNVADASSANGANVQQYTCVGASNERWYLQPDNPTNPTYFYMKAKHSGKCLDIAGGSTANNGNAQQYDCVGVTNERWQIEPAGAGYFTIKNVNSQKCLTVAGNLTTDNTNVDQYTCLGQDNQKWRWNYFAAKTVQLVRAHYALGGPIGMTNAQWDLLFETARTAMLPYGISLSSQVLDVNNASLNKLDANDDPTLYSCTSPAGVDLGFKKPFDCATAFAKFFPGKIVAYATASAGGVSYARLPWLQIAGVAYPDACTIDQCSTTGSDNRVHFAHELGHWFGLRHTFHTAGDDWLADTEVDDTGGDSCLAQGSNPPAVGNNLMSYFYSCNPKYSPIQGGIIRAEAYIKYATGTN